MSPAPFELPHGQHLLRGDAHEPSCNTVVLHGAGKSSRARFTRLRETLNDLGMPSAAFDFVGHGETGGELIGSSLRDRSLQAAAVIDHACNEPLTLIAASMSAYTAIRLTETFTVKNLILLVPAVYTSEAYDLPFGPEFSAAIRVRNSWRNSDAFGILKKFKGNLLVIAAENDAVIPMEVIEGIHASTANSETNRLHIVPGSEHLSLFPTTGDFTATCNLIMETCRDEENVAP